MALSVPRSRNSACVRPVNTPVTVPRQKFGGRRVISNWQSLELPALALGTPFPPALQTSRARLAPTIRYWLTAQRAMVSFMIFLLSAVPLGWHPNRAAPIRLSYIKQRNPGPESLIIRRFLYAAQRCSHAPACSRRLGGHWRLKPVRPGSPRAVGDPADLSTRNWGLYYSLSYLGIARGSALAGDTAKAKKAFQDFFQLWQGADRDVPILQQAKAEYATLH